jgi:hypothetical protein
VATTKPMRSRKRPERVAALVLLGLATIACTVVAYRYFNRPPQMGNDEEVFRTVDALFTAVTARDEKLVGQCEQRLNALRAGGELPASAAKSLDRIIRQARSGDWQEAAEKLYAFMMAQRR